MKEREITPLFDRSERQLYVADAPISFAQWLDVSQSVDSELVRGVIKQKMAAQYPHEWIFMWLSTLLTNFVEYKRLGRVLGSRTPVRITEYDGRLPDILFVRADNLSIIRKDAVYGTPDMVIEIVSENDRPSDLLPLEADYRTIGVPEIVFIDPRKKRVRHLVKADDDYDEVFLTTGSLRLATIPGFEVEVAWLFDDEKPNPYEITQAMIAAKTHGENG